MRFDGIDEIDWPLAGKQDGLDLRIVRCGSGRVGLMKIDWVGARVVRVVRVVGVCKCVI